MHRQKLIDTYLPDFTFREFHAIVINSSMGRVYQETKDFDMAESPLILWLFRLRGLPTRRMNLQGFLSDIGFTRIEENEPVEHLIGFWARWRIAPITGYEDFVGNAISARVKVVWNFYLEQRAPGQIKLSTETRVLCTSVVTRLTFGLYWLAIRPFSGLIRREMLGIIKRASERGLTGR